MKKLIYLFLTTLLTLNHYACKKSSLSDDDIEMPPLTELEKLPPITTEGANTFGCLVNGEAWIPEGYIFPESNFDVYYDKNYSHILNISTYQTNNDEPTQRLTIGGILVGNSLEVDTFNFLNMRKFNPCDRYQNLLNHVLIISRLDTVNKVISGTFEFLATEDEDDGCIDTIIVSDGRFDAVYRE